MTTTASNPDIQQLLDRARFNAWLRRHNPGANVGSPNRPRACPIVTYLIAYGIEAPVVKGGRIRFGEHRIRMPRWMDRFVASIDRLEHVAVRAHEAWTILEAQP